MSKLPYGMTVYHGPVRQQSERITTFWFNALIVATILLSAAGAWIDFAFFFGAVATALIFTTTALIPRRRQP